MAGAAPADLSIGAPRTPEVEAEPIGIHVGDQVGPELLDDLEVVPPVDESVVRGLLGSIGGGIGYVAGDDDVADHWRFTRQELDDLTPPLTRIINRRARLRRAVMHGDEATVAVLLAGYTGRNVAAGQVAKEARNERDREAAAAPGDPRADDPRPHGQARWDGRDGGRLHGSPS